MAKTWKYGKGTANYITTDALEKYRDENNLSTAELALKTGDSPMFLSRCISRQRIPRLLLENLGIVAREKRQQYRQQNSIPSKGTIYACYVGGGQKEAFLAFCHAMHINAKDMI